MRAKSAIGYSLSGHTASIPLASLTEDQHVPNPWPAILGPPAQLDTILFQHGVTQVILLQLPEATSGFEDLLRIVHKRGARLVILSNLDEQLHHPVFSFEDDGLNFFTFHLEPLENPFHRVIKRLLDLVIAIPAAFIAFPLAALLVKIVQAFQSPGPLLYRQTRAGIQNRRFEILKFRTMHSGSGEPARQAIAGDPRIFPAGRFLRRYSVDEIPQFLNVLREYECRRAAAPPGRTQRQVRGGVVELSHSSLRQAGNDWVRSGARFSRGVHERDEIAARLKSDLVYLENWSLILDLSIIVRQRFVCVSATENSTVVGPAGVGSAGEAPSKSASEIPTGSVAFSGPLWSKISASRTNFSRIWLHKYRSLSFFAALPIGCSCSDRWIALPAVVQGLRYRPAEQQPRSDLFRRRLQVLNRRHRLPLHGLPAEQALKSLLGKNALPDPEITDTTIRSASASISL